MFVFCFFIYKKKGKNFAADTKNISLSALPSPGYAR